MTFKYILLMRHGEHEAAGPSDRPIRRLTDRGKKETAEVAERLVSVIKELGKSKMTASPSVRCGAPLPKRPKKPKTLYRKR